MEKHINDFMIKDIQKLRKKGIVKITSSEDFFNRKINFPQKDKNDKNESFPSNKR